MGKTPEYTKRAINNYREKFKMVQIRIDKNYYPEIEKQYIKSGFNTFSDYVLSLIAQDMNSNPAPDQSGPVEGCPF